MGSIPGRGSGSQPESRRKLHPAAEQPDPRARLALDFARWLFTEHGVELVDRYDFGAYSHHDRHPVYAAPTARLEAWQTRATHIPPQRLTGDLIARHLRGSDRLYYVPKRSSGYSLVRVDVDAHQGQTDAPAAVELVRAHLFPGAYAEPSPRGFGVYALTRVGQMRRARFNELLTAIQHALRTMLAAAGIAATVEVQGNFTLCDAAGHIEIRGKLGALPRLPRGRDDLDALRTAPVYLVGALMAFVRQQKGASCSSTRNAPGTSKTQIRQDRRQKRTQSSGLERGLSPALGSDGVSACAWERMQRACFRFTEEFRRLPDVEELLAYYGRQHDAGPETPARRKRARDAIRYRAKTFDYAAPPQAGYDADRDQLHAAVRDHCVNRADRFRGTLTDEDLAVGLYVVTRASFAIHEDDRRQWTVGHAAVMAMFESLHREGATRRRCPSRHKSGAILRVLERAGLIECQDRRYKPAGRRHGVCRKWTIGPTHPRYGEFCRFGETVRVTYLGRRAAAENSEDQPFRTRVLKGSGSPAVQAMRGRPGRGMMPEEQGKSGREFPAPLPAEQGKTPRSALPENRAAEEPANRADQGRFPLRNRGTDGLLIRR